MSGYTRPPRIDSMVAYLVVALLQSLLRKTLPAFRPIDGLSGLQRYIEVTALDSEVEARVFVLYKVQCDL